MGRYGICSDSLGGSYLECLEPEALTPSFHHLRDDPVTFEMQRYRQSFPPILFAGILGHGQNAELLDFDDAQIAEAPKVSFT